MSRIFKQLVEEFIDKELFDFKNEIDAQFKGYAQGVLIRFAEYIYKGPRKVCNYNPTQEVTLPQEPNKEFKDKYPNSTEIVTLEELKKECNFGCENKMYGINNTCPIHNKLQEPKKIEKPSQLIQEIVDDTSFDYRDSCGANNCDCYDNDINIQAIIKVLDKLNE